jgi:hypothetical protein
VVAVLPANASGFGPHRASITGRVGQARAGGGASVLEWCWGVPAGGAAAGGVGRRVLAILVAVLVSGAIVAAVSRAFPSCTRSILTEIYLCHACSCHEINISRTGRACSLSRPC